MISFSHVKRIAFPALLALLLSAGSMEPASAFANCSASPEPGVDWTRCVMGDISYENVDLSGAKLVSARLGRSDFDHSNFTNVKARNVNLVSSSLKQAIFDGADLQDADMTRADLGGASFKGARLLRTRFYRANLKGADFTGADLDETDLLHADLTGARWTDGEKICAEGSIGRCR